MWKSKTSLIGITMGDPAGIGPEVIAKALSKPSLRRLGRFLIIGDYAVYKKYSPTHFENVFFLDIKPASGKKISIGDPSPSSAKASLLYLDKALELLKQGEIKSLVTAPVCKEAISALGRKFEGHTEYIARYFKIKNFEMMFVAPNLKTVVATRHIPLKDVSRSVTAQNILKTILLTNQGLKEYFHTKNPAIALCGINPHAGENGLMGREEIRTLLPAMRKAKQAGINVCGPFPADTLFYPSHARKFDAIIAMYHDQGLIPVKTLYFDKLVNFTLGLPFIRTSPAHGTAFDIAGKNKADASSMCEAIKLTAQLAR